MPTIKPRVAVTLEPQTHAVIERIAFFQGRSRGAVISDLLDSVAPALTRTVSLLEAAAAAPDQVKQGLIDVIEGVHGQLVAASGDAISQLDTIINSGGNSGAQGEANPHVVTRGSGIPVRAEKAHPTKPRKPIKPRGVGHE